MNKIKFLSLILFTLLVCASLEAQNVSSRGEVKTTSVVQHRTGTSFATWTYIAQTDTMQAIPVHDWSQTYYVIEVKDSASFIIGYQPSYDGVTFYPTVTIDSLSSANNAGNAISIQLPVKAAGCRAVKFTRIVGTFRLGVTSATAHESIRQIK